MVPVLSAKRQAVDVAITRQLPQQTAAFGRKALLTCGLCEQAFANAQKLCVHRANRHGIRPPIEMFAGTSTCRSCMTDFNAWKRLIRLLHHDSPECAQAVLSFGPLGSDELSAVGKTASAYNSANRAAGFSLPELNTPAVEKQGPIRWRPATMTDPAILALGQELASAAENDDLKLFCELARDSIEVLVKSSLEELIFVEDLLPASGAPGIAPLANLHVLAQPQGRVARS